MFRFLLAMAYVCITLLLSLFTMARVALHDRKGNRAVRDRLTFGLARRWAGGIVRAAGARVAVRGLEQLPAEGSVLFVSNHQGTLDIPLLLGFIPMPTGFIAKKEIEKIPIIGTWMTYMKCIFMDRGSIRQSLAAINQGAEHLKLGYSLVIFPEGTRSRTDELLEFKPGSLKLAQKAGVPIVPVTIAGSADVFGRHGLRLRPGPVSLTFSPPIAPEEYRELEAGEIAKRFRSIIQRELDAAHDR